MKLEKILHPISRDSGYTRNPWSTGIRDLILDFGLLGSLIFMFLYGCTAQYFYERSLKSSNPFYIIGGSFVLASCILFPFLSPFGLNSFINPLLILIVIYYLSKLRFEILKDKGIAVVFGGAGFIGIFCTIFD